MNVADGNGQGVGRVGGLGCSFQFKKIANHEADLLFRGKAVAHHGTFYGQRSVFGDRVAAVGRREKRDAAHLAELQGTFGVGGEEDVLDGNTRGLPLIQKRGELGVDLGQANGRVVFTVQANGAGAEMEKPWRSSRVIDLDHAVACELCPTVDTEDPHSPESTSSPRFPTQYNRPESLTAHSMQCCFDL